MTEEKGFWAPHTATIDWCESNYVVSDYIAEFWNTLSNLVMILLPLYGVYWSWSHSSYADKYSSKSKPLFRVSKSIVWCHIGLVLVGLGSWAFHMTLLYPAQLLDEIPMIFGSALLIYGNYDILIESFQFDNGKNWRPKSLIGRLLYSNSFVGFAIASYCLFYIYIYLFVWKSPIFHQCAYALMTFVIVGENITLIYRYKLKKRLYMVSLSYYLFGFFLWNLDNAFCPFLQQYRTQVDQFFSLDSGSQWKRVLFNVFAVSLKALSEFHSLWHIFTGYAAFMTILFLIEVHYKHFLLVNNKTEERVQKPIGSRFFNFFYYLSNNLLSTDRETESSKTPKRKKY